MTEQEKIPAYLKFKAYSPYASFSKEATSRWSESALFSICDANGALILDRNIGITKNVHYWDMGMHAYSYLADNHFHHDPSDGEILQLFYSIHKDLYKYVKKVKQQILDGAYVGFSCFVDGQNVGSFINPKASSKDDDGFAELKRILEDMHGPKAIFKEATQDDILKAHRVSKLDGVAVGIAPPNDLNLYDRAFISGYLDFDINRGNSTNNATLCMFCLERLDQIGIAEKNGGEGIVSASMDFQKLYDMSNIEPEKDDDLIVQDARSAHGRNAALARHGKGSHKLKEFAISEYQTGGFWKNPRQASRVIFPKLQEFARENNIAPLSKDRGPDTVCEWLRKAPKHK